MKKLTTEFVKEEYKKRGYEFLDETYMNSRQKHNIKCLKCGLEWKQRYHGLKNGFGCPKCAKILKHNLEFVQEEYSKIGYEFLDKVYINGRYKHNIKCSNEYIFKQKFGNFYNQKHQCPECGETKRKQTMLKKYGVDNPTKNLDIALRAAKGMNRVFINFHWKTKQELICQGSWEFKVVDYLNINKINYLWQPIVFTLSDGKTYRPDLYLVDDNKWIEIKGYFRKDALEKWNEFHTKLKPNSELWDQKKLKELSIL